MTYQICASGFFFILANTVSLENKMRHPLHMSGSRNN